MTYNGMEKAILDFGKQFAFSPRVENARKLKVHNKFTVCGMGGSNLVMGLLKIANPAIDALEHRNYGLPPLSVAALKDRLNVAVSYSGNTGETLSSFAEARRRGLPLAVIATGGKLLRRAEKYGVPYVELPITGIQPRMALGFITKALLKLMPYPELYRQAGALATVLKPNAVRSAGKQLARNFKNHVPVIYASDANRMIAYNWKIKFNETGKIPAFYNVLPELNHNEMTGFDAKPKSRHLSERFHFVLHKDQDDDARIQRRMEMLARIYRARKLPITVLPLRGKNKLHKTFSSLILADWAAFYTAKQYGLESEQVPVVEEFKKLIS
ncbi:hypothetical protein HY477_03785 [Candidatus Uhrbacteria bacterium]|nr:hypothetical protein [Candidatus Uhrbacteria bacterium]